MMPPLRKYPRTAHIQGSRLQPGDEDMEAVAFEEIAGRHLVIEEKMDGANAGIRFDDTGVPLLQSRGHYLTGGAREKHFNLFKQWAHVHAAALWERLGSRYVLYGEWLYAKHTIFYDLLPHYFMEFDVLDTSACEFLDTPRRARLLEGLPIVSVKVLMAGPLRHKKELAGLLGRSLFISADRVERLRGQCASRHLDFDRIERETDPSTDMEGLYIKVEEDGIVKGRYKYIRGGFLTSVVDSQSHWLNRPIVPNVLREGVDIMDLGSAAS